MPDSAVSILAGAVVVDGPAGLGSSEELTLAVAGLTVAFSISDDDGRLNRPGRRSRPRTRPGMSASPSSRGPTSGWASTSG